MAGTARRRRAADAPGTRPVDCSGERVSAPLATGSSPKNPGGRSEPRRSYCARKATDKDVNQVFAAGRPQAMLTQYLHELGRGDCLEIGTDQDPGDGRLDAGRLGDGKQTRQFLETFGIR